MMARRALFHPPAYLHYYVVPPRAHKQAKPQSICTLRSIMRFSNLAATLLAVGSANAFVFQQPQNHAAASQSSASRSSALMMASSNNSDDATSDPFAVFRNVAATAALAAAIWSGPNAVVGPSATSTTLLPEGITSAVVANAKEMASGSGSRVNKDPESLLRYGLPIDNKEVRQLQPVIEEIRQDISTKRKAAALDGAKKAKSILKGKAAEKMTKACREPAKCSAIIDGMVADIDPLEAALSASQDAGRGSEQERKAQDDAYAAQDALQKKLTNLEEQMVSQGYVTPVPDDYADLPLLRGRATVEMVLKKADGGPFDVEGTNYPEAKMKMIIDGYTAPVTGGNFIELVDKGFYSKMEIQRSDGFVVQTGDPAGEADGYVGTPSKSVGAGKHGERLLPLETFLKGDKGPFYETTMEDEGRGGQATVLPFSAYGAMGWARDEYEPNSGSSQFFWLLFDSDLTPAGKNVLDGRYPVFGYVVEGADFLRDTKEGDIIVSAKVTEGIENLVQPK